MDPYFNTVVRKVAAARKLGESGAECSATERSAASGDSYKQSTGLARLESTLSREEQVLAKLRKGGQKRLFWTTSGGEGWV